MNKKSEALTLDVVRERFRNKGLILLTDKYYNNHQLLDCEDKEGYRYNTNVNNLEKFNLTKLTYTFNKWSIYNINKYIENNDISIQLLTKEYKGSHVPMAFRCKCGQTYYASWSDVQHRKRYYCHNCVVKYGTKRLNKDFIISEYEKVGLTILKGQEYKNMNEKIECMTKDGYKIFKKYGNISKSFKNNIFSYKYNKKNYVYNVNNYFHLNNIKGKCLEVLDYTSGYHGQYYIIMQCECGNIFRSCIDYIRNGHYKCSYCNKIMSYGELEIKKTLENMNINFIMQHKFDDCVYVRPLLFDFYLPSYNCCIEYDGEQHYYQVGFQTKEDFINGIKRDKVKNKYCDENNIKLIRIPYFELKNIKKVITNSIKE